VQAGYFVKPQRLEVAGRYSYADGNDFGLAAAARAALGRTHHEATVGGSYLAGEGRVKLQVEYSYLIDTDVAELAGASRYSHRARAQLQVAF
jgi:hypothetical protein